MTYVKVHERLHGSSVRLRHTGVLCGLVSDKLEWKLGLIIMIAFWVIAFALRVFLVTKNDD
jgi:hypothetical protein